MEYDIERLRKDLIEFLQGAFFIGGFGAATIDINRLYAASPDEVISIALQNGFNLNEYLNSYSRY